MRRRLPTWIALLTALFISLYTVQYAEAEEKAVGTLQSHVTSESAPDGTEKRHIGALAKNGRLPMFQAGTKRDEDADLGRTSGGHLPLNADEDKDSDNFPPLDEIWPQSKRHIGAFLKSHGKPTFNGNEAKRHLGAFLNSHGKPTFSQTGNKRLSSGNVDSMNNFWQEDKRHIGSFLNNYGRPVFSGKEGKRSSFESQDSEIDTWSDDKRHIGAFMKSHGRPVFAVNEAKRYSTGKESGYSEDKRHIGAFLNNHGRPVFSESEAKRLSNEIQDASSWSEDKRHVGAFLNSHGRPVFSGKEAKRPSPDGEDSDIISVNTRHVGAFLNSHGKPVFSGTETKRMPDENFDSSSEMWSQDKRHIGAFLNSRGRPVFNDNEENLSSADDQNPALDTLSHDKGQPLFGEPPFIDQMEPTRGNQSVVSGDKRHIGAFLRSHGRPVFGRLDDIPQPPPIRRPFPPPSGARNEDKRHLGAFLKTHGRPLFNEGVKNDPSNAENHPSKRHIGAFLKSHGKPMFREGEDKRTFTLEDDPSEKGFSEDKRHLGAFLKNYGRPTFDNEATKSTAGETPLEEETTPTEEEKRNIGAFLKSHGKPLFRENKRTSEEEKLLDVESKRHVGAFMRTHGRPVFSGNENKRVPSEEDDSWVEDKRHIGSFLGKNGKPVFSNSASEHVRQHRSVSQDPSYEEYADGGEDEDDDSSWYGISKRNIAALARKGWLNNIRNLQPVPVYARFTESGSKREPQYQGRSEEEESYANSNEDCTDVEDDLESNRIAVKRNIGALARSGRLPPWHRRGEWWTYKRGLESLAKVFWPRHPLFGSLADKRQHFVELHSPSGKSKRCKKEIRPPNSEETNQFMSNAINQLVDVEDFPNEEMWKISKRNIAMLARKGMLPKTDYFSLP